MDSKIVGLNGRPIDEEKVLVDALGNTVSSEETNSLPMPETDPITEARMQFQTVMTRLVGKFSDKKAMSRGDLAEATKLLTQANHLNFIILSMAMQDVIALIGQLEEQKMTSYVIGNQIAALLQLLMEKEVFTKEEMNVKWKEVAEKAKEDILKARKEQKENCCDCEECNECGKEK